jgi:hypothetical protein
MYRIAEATSLAIGASIVPALLGALFIFVVRF